jgi:hypothetical protein
MDPVTSFLRQIARLEAQNRLESDPDLIQENKKTIKELHIQARKAAKYRHPWHGVISNAAWLLFLFLVVVFVLLKFAALFGLGRTLGASVTAIVVLILSACIVLLTKRAINQGTFKDIVKIGLAALPGKKPPK